MILLTGASGFIGQNFAQSLQDDILAVDVEDAFHFINNFTNWDSITLIIHQGALSSTQEHDWEKVYRFNVVFSIELMEHAIAHGIPFKYASSAGVYGKTGDVEAPRTLYAQSKLLVDEWVRENQARFHSVQGFRYFNVYGNMEEKKVLSGQSSPVSKFLHDARQEGEIRVFEGSENFFRDFICVNDVVKIVMANDEGSGIYDLGTGVPRSFDEVARIVADFTGVPIRRVPFPEKLAYGYQEFTCSNVKWDHNFLTIEEYLYEYCMD